MTIVPVHWAAEWLRPVTPDYKHVGSVLAGPGKPLPAPLEVSHPARQPGSIMHAAAAATRCGHADT